MARKSKKKKGKLYTLTEETARPGQHYIDKHGKIRYKQKISPKTQKLLEQIEQSKKQQKELRKAERLYKQLTKPQTVSKTKKNGTTTKSKMKPISESAEIPEDVLELGQKATDKTVSFGEAAEAAKQFNTAVTTIGLLLQDGRFWAMVDLLRDWGDVVYSGTDLIENVYMPERQSTAETVRDMLSVLGQDIDVNAYSSEQLAHLISDKIAETRAPEIFGNQMKELETPGIGGPSEWGNGF